MSASVAARMWREVRPGARDRRWGKRAAPRVSRDGPDSTKIPTSIQRLFCYQANADFKRRLEVAVPKNLVSFTEGCQYPSQ